MPEKFHPSPLPSFAHSENFAARLIARLSPESSLTDAASRLTVPANSLRAAVAYYAQHCTAAGLNTGDRILISCKLSPASTLAYLAALWSGLVVIPLDEKVFKADGDKIAKAVQARAAWAERDPELDWTRTAGLVSLSQPSEFPTPPSHPSPPVDLPAPAPVAADSLAALMTTSGSTGAPRFVQVTHQNLTANTEAIIRSQHLRDHEKALLILPLNYCFGASVIHSHLYAGGSVVFDRRFLYPDTVLAAITQFSCTTFAGVPTVYNRLLRQSAVRSLPLPTLRRWIQAGGPLPPEQVQELASVLPSARVYVMYGQTEATARLTTLDPEFLTPKLGSVGRPLDNLTLEIRDETGRALPRGETGEVWASGPSITAGYWLDPDETARKFHNGWLRTGDLGKVDEDGFLWIQGRKEGFIKMRGIRLSLAEVEARVAALPGVFECAAASKPHPDLGEVLALYIVPSAPQPPADFTESLKRQLPAQWLYDSIRVVAAIPKTSNGKIARAQLATLDA